MSLPPAQFNTKLLINKHYGSSANPVAKPVNTTPKIVETASNALSTMALATDALMKKGTPMMITKAFFAKMGMFTNSYKAVTEWKNDNNMEAGIYFARTLAALGTAPMYNAVDGMSNARDTFNHFQNDEMHEALLSGSKLAVNLLGFAFPQMTLAIRLAQLGHEFNSE